MRDKVTLQNNDVYWLKSFTTWPLNIKPKQKTYKERTEVCFNEGIFWSLEVNRKRRNLKIPDYKVAFEIFIRNNLLLSCTINNMDCPFGCHAFNKHIAFWKPTLGQFGYE